MSTPTENAAGKCPVMHGALTTGDQTVTEWWPKTLNLDILHQHDTRTDPMGAGFDYREAVKSLDFDAVKADLHVIKTSDDVALANVGKLRRHPGDVEGHPD